jgi:hemolysin activation/secretion protein
VKNFKLTILVVIGCLLSYPVRAQQVLVAEENDIDFTLVNNIVVEGSTIFSQDEIDRIISKYEGKELSFAQMLAVRDSITNLYVTKGHTTSGAYLPPQDIKGGKLTIAVLEGGVEEIAIKGSKHLNSGYIRSRLPHAKQTPVNVQALLDDLQLLRQDPLIASVSAELKTGVRPGATRLDIAVEEADNFAVTAILDNQRTPSVGSFRRGGNLTHRDLLGFGDKLSLDYFNSEGSNSFEVGYDLPVNGKDGRLSFKYGVGSNDVVEEPFNPLDIELESNYYEFGFRQPIVRKPGREFALGLNFTRQNSKSSLSDIPFALSRGADESGKTKISALRFTQEYIARSDRSVFGLKSQFNVGLDLFGSTINDDTPDSTFVAWQGQSQWARELAEDTLILVRGDLQLSGSSLVPLEQFRLGGVNSVRGYRQDLSLGDSGINGSAEIRLPIARWQKVDGVLQITPFFDVGAAWNSDDVEIERKMLASTGIGLNLELGKRLNARLDWGIPLIAAEKQGNSLQENGVYFSLSSSF